MARLFIDGFESGSLDLWEVVKYGAYSTPLVIDSSKYSGNYALQIRVNNYDGYVQKNIAGISTIYFMFRLMAVSGSHNATVFSVLDTGATQLCLVLNADRTLTLRRGNFVGTVLATTASIATADEWIMIEGRLVIDSVAGIAQIKINGVMEIDFAGNTRGGSTNNINQVALGLRYGGAASNSAGLIVDDLVLDDSEWIGDSRVQALVPVGAGNSTQWTPTAGENWECVDEVPPSNDDQVGTNANDQLDLYSAGNLVGSVNAVKCVQLQVRCNKEGAPTPQNIKLACKTHGTNYESASLPIPTISQSKSKIWQNNPNTGANWTVQEVNDLEIGIKSAA
ncbi:MAG: hypothetical protein PHU44_13620 [Syntrophales bacterium]|nr:hypothetical protein [Syntrophales bacterium]MDD5640155.1 hypothetical protein [Syntrophales bacterium]